MQLRVVSALAVAVVVFLAGCGDADEPATEDGGDATEAGIVVEDAWVRATPPGTTTTGGFMVLSNEGEADDALIGASVSEDVAADVQIHETVTEEGSGSAEEMSSDEVADDAAGDDASDETGGMPGMARMREITVLEIPAGESVELAPGGYHLMLMEAAALEEGDTIKVTLSFRDSPEQEIEAVVRPL